MAEYILVIRRFKEWLKLQVKKAIVTAPALFKLSRFVTLQLNGAVSVKEEQNPLDIGLMLIKLNAKTGISFIQ